jgi:hypothetical protein
MPRLPRHGRCQRRRHARGDRAWVARWLLVILCLLIVLAALAFGYIGALS